MSRRKGKGRRNADYTAIDTSLAQHLPEQEPSELERAVQTSPSRRWDDGEGSLLDEIKRIYTNFDKRSYLQELKECWKSKTYFTEIRPTKGKKILQATALGNTMIAGSIAMTLALTAYLIYDIGTRPLHRPTSFSASPAAPWSTAQPQPYQHPVKERP